jgi:hypothetical protein
MLMAWHILKGNGMPLLLLLLLLLLLRCCGCCCCAYAAVPQLKHNTIQLTWTLEDAALRWGYCLHVAAFGLHLFARARASDGVGLSARVDAAPDPVAGASVCVILLVMHHWHLELDIALKLAPATFAMRHKLHRDAGKCAGAGT